jgi:hypothetical protein
VSEREDRERAAEWAASRTIVLSAVAWTAIVGFSFAWDCDGRCTSEHGRFLVSGAINAMIIFAAAALLLGLALRLRARLGSREGIVAAVVSLIVLVFASIGILGMAAGFTLAAFTNAGVIEGLSVVPWFLGSFAGALIMGVFAAVVGGGTWRAAKPRSRSESPA